MNDIYGIDLGTTFCAAALVRGGACSVLDLDGRKTLASLVWLKQNGGNVVATVGSSAWDMVENARSSQDGRMIGSSKRFMGHATGPGGAEPPWRFGGFAYDARDVGALILRRIRKSIDEERMHDGTVRAIITHPAYFPIPAKVATKQAAELAGIEVVDTITEPGAAVFAYQAQSTAGGRFLVFDLGGGTLDIAVAETDADGMITVKRHSGSAQLGGVDWDRAVLEMVVEQFQGNYPDVDFHSMASQATQQLWLRDCCLMKEKLSKQDNFRNLFSLEMDGEILTHRAEVSRNALEARTIGYVSSCRERVVSTLDACGLKTGDITDVLLVGGSTQMPMIRLMLSDLFDRKIGERRVVEPDLAVAAGAAFAAWGKSQAQDNKRPLDQLEGGAADDQTGITRGKKVNDCLARDLRVAEVDDSGNDICTVVVPASSVTPLERREIFYTAFDNQPSIKVKVYEGDSNCPDDCISVGEVVVSGLPKRPKGQRVEVTFIVSDSGRLEVIVTDLQTRISAKNVLNVANASEDDLTARKAYLDRIVVE